jgi:hypothetical protein
MARANKFLIFLVFSPMPYYKIIIHMRDGRRKSGIRQYSIEDAEEVRKMIWWKVYDVMGRWRVDYVEVEEMAADGPELMAWIEWTKK